MSIHPTALVSKKAKLGKDTVIGPYSIVEDNVSIGDSTKIAEYVVIRGNVTIGKNCEIFTGAVIGSRPQDLKYKGEKSYLVIGDNNIIREYATINPGTGEGGKTVIGNNNLLMANAHVAHDCVIGDHCILVNCAMLAGHVKLEDHVLISGLVGVHQFVKVGRLSIIGGVSKATQDVPPFATCDGPRADLYGLNLIGLRRNNVSRESISQLKKAYKILFYSGLPMKKAIEELAKAKLSAAEVEHLVKFIKDSERGIVRPAKSSHEDQE